MNNNKISVIVPVYNAEKSLKRCIESLIGQTYSNIEIILVNDGSNDNSLSICKLYEKKDKRVKVIDKKNKGVSSCRNIGISLATGDYITFVDSDDYMEKEAYFECIEIMKDTNVDLLKFSYYKETKNNKIRYSFKTVADEIVFTKDKSKYINEIFTSKDFEAVWNLIIRKKIINECKIRFDESLVVAEDFKFNNECLINSSKIYIVNKPYYHYIINSESVTQKYDLKKLLLRCDNIIKSYTDCCNMHSIQLKNNENCIKKATKLIYGKITIIAENEKYINFRDAVRKINESEIFIDFVSDTNQKNIPYNYFYYCYYKFKGIVRTIGKRIIFR